MWDDEYAQDRESEPVESERQICGDCGGTGLNYLNPADGGSCPSCIGGYRI